MTITSYQNGLAAANAWYCRRGADHRPGIASLMRFCETLTSSQWHESFVAVEGNLPPAAFQIAELLHPQWTKADSRRRSEKWWRRVAGRGSCGDAFVRGFAEQVLHEHFVSETKNLYAEMKALINDLREHASPTTRKQCKKSLLASLAKAQEICEIESKDFHQEFKLAIQGIRQIRHTLDALTAMRDRGA